MMGYGSVRFLKTEGRLFEQIALAVGAGTLVNYCLILTGLTLGRVFVAGMALALWGVLSFFTDLRARWVNGVRGFKLPVFAACSVAYLFIIYYFEIFSEPLLHWDARSIWFFHAKMIWTEGAVRQSAGWSHPSLAFSHPDYPNLVPAIAAQLAYVKGYWNEFLPKGSLLVMLGPLVLWVFSFRERSAGFVLLVLVFFFSLDGWLSNGYMDGYLALYGGAALLLFGRYLSEGRDTDLYSGICAAGICAGLKNEGLLFGLCVITALIFIRPEHRGSRLRSFSNRIKTDSRFATILFLSIAPTLLWAISKKAWGVGNPITAVPSEGWSRLSIRLFDGSTPQYLLNYLVVRATALWVVVGLVAATVTFALYQRLKLPRGALVAAVTSALYVCGIYVVYLSTPYGLNFHLSTSATRTMVTAEVALFVSLFFLLSGLEAHEAEI